jgi:phage baseplate assembly protein W
MGTFGETINIDSPTFRRLADNTAILLQGVRMRLGTAPGMYFNDPEYGFDLEELLMDGLTDERLAQLGARIAQEIEKDHDRVQSANVRLSATSAGSNASATFVADITPVDGDNISLTISVPDLTVELLLRGA